MSAAHGFVLVSVVPYARPEHYRYLDLTLTSGLGIVRPPTLRGLYGRWGNRHAGGAMAIEQTGIDRAAERRDALVGRLFQATLGAMDLFNLYIGDRLGLYRALADGGPATAPELAQRAGIDARYAREWLEGQAVGDILSVDDPGKAADDRRY